MTVPILAINAGSSSIKFALFERGQPLKRRLGGRLDRIGSSGTALTFQRGDEDAQTAEQPGVVDQSSAVDFIVGWLDQQLGLKSVIAAGHRVVNGGPNYSSSQVITPALLEELHSITAYAPEHLPPEIILIERLAALAPDLLQVACFDTSFHWNMPRVAKILPIPRRFEAKGVRRYGFHGLSYAFLMEELARIAGPEAARGRIVLAHLGNGASLAAVRGGMSIDTSMAFTPAAGIPMGSRSGDLDPGLVLYFAQTERMTPVEFNTMVNHQSGLLGVSETSSDMRDLLAREASDGRAAESVALFCYQIKKCIGAYAAALGGIDTLVFSGGVGENAHQARARICDGLGFLGIDIDVARNSANQPLISASASPVTVRVIRTDEELMIAGETSDVWDRLTSTFQGTGS